MKMRMLTRMICFVLLPACLGFCVLTLVSDNMAGKGMRSQINEDLSLLVGVQARELDNILGMLRSTTANMAVNAHTREYLDAFAKGSKDLPQFAEEAMETLKDTVASYPRIKQAGIIGMDGIINVHTDPNRKGENVNSRPYFTDAVRSGKVVINTRYSDSTKSFVCLMVAPVKEQGRIIGAALCEIDLEALATTTTDRVRVAKTGFCFFYTPEGRIISHPDKKLVGVDQSNLDWTKTILRQEKGTLVYPWQGMNKVAYYQRVPATNWTVVLGVDEADVMSPITAMSRATAILGVSIALLVGVIIFIIARNMAQVLRGCAALAQYVAAGNFTLTPAFTAQLDKDCRRSDEIGDLSQALRSMISSLADLFTSSAQKTKEAEEATAQAGVALKKAEEAMRQAEAAKREGMLAAASHLEEAVAVISSASTQLAAQIEQAENGSVEQAARITSTATAMEEMNSTVLEVARNAGEASQLAGDTRDMAESGAKVVQQAVSAIGEVQNQSRKLKEDMSSLDESARSINQIMGVISDIADQTNLLALNAAIEAARAGEAGRGFAVVADEVRKLAEKTMASTVDVGKAIKTMQQATSQSVAQVDSSIKTIDEATDFANESGQALTKIVGMVDQSADQVRSIATSSEQQSATSEEITGSITLVNSIASETAQAMKESAVAVGELARQAQVLKGLIEDMKRG